jgi:heptosyltransferase-2
MWRPSARHATKVWLKERFAEAATSLASRHDAGVLLFGSQEESGRCAEIGALIRTAGPQRPVMNLAGKLSLLETAAAMDRCALVLTNDSGLMHVAAARRRKVVAVFGPSVRALGFLPFRTENVVLEHPHLRCRPCSHIGLPACPRGHFKCMNDITAAHVIAGAERLLAH